MFRNVLRKNVKNIFPIFDKRSGYSRSHVIGRTFNYPKSKCILTNTTQEQIVNYDRELKDKLSKDELSKGKFLDLSKNLPESLNANPQVPSDIFTPLSDEKMNRVIYDYCKSIEPRKIRHHTLYTEYVSNVFFSMDGLVSIKNLENMCGLSPFEVLLCLESRGLVLNGYKTTNPFNLPEKAIIAKVMYDSTTEESIEKIISRLKEEYVVITEKTQNNKTNLEKYYLRKYDYVILKKDDDYDYLQLRINCNKLDENVDVINLVMFEENNPNKYHDRQTLEKIFEIASLKSNKYINKIGNVYIVNKFDGSHTYDMKKYDEHYGFGAFNTALLQKLSSKMNLSGDASIKHQKTIDSIDKSADIISLGDSQLQKKLYNDFVNFSTHFNDDARVQIGDLMDLYGIESHELLYVMYKFNTPVGLGAIEFMNNLNKATSFNLEDAKIVLKERNYYVDYLLGKPIKNTFRREKGSGQKINIYAYDHVDQGKFYGIMMWLMASKLHNTQHKIVSNI
jgi:hypothetical protein